MIELPHQITKSGFKLTQVWREKDVAIYQQQSIRPGDCPPYFEVVRVQSHNGITFPNGKTAPPSEYMPSSESWGRDAFTCATLPRAIERAYYLLRQDAHCATRTSP